MGLLLVSTLSPQSIDTCRQPGMSIGCSEFVLFQITHFGQFDYCNLNLVKKPRAELVVLYNSVFA